MCVCVRARARVCVCAHNICIHSCFPCSILDPVGQTPSPIANDWVEVFDCNPPGGTIADRQLMTRDNVMKAMKTAHYIAICDDGASPHKRDKCVFAKRGTEPFENLAKGHVINANRASCDYNCLKQWWTGDNLRIGWMTFTCKATSASDYSGALMYHACGNGHGLHMFAQEGRWVGTQG